MLLFSSQFSLFTFCKSLHQLILICLLDNLCKCDTTDKYQNGIHYIREGLKPSMLLIGNKIFKAHIMECICKFHQDFMHCCQGLHWSLVSGQQISINLSERLGDLNSMWETLRILRRLSSKNQENNYVFSCIFVNRFNLFSIFPVPCFGQLYTLK